MVLSAVFLLIFTLSRNSYSIELTDDGINVDVYIIALEDVGASAVDNVSRVVEGVQQAVNSLNPEGYKYWWKEDEHLGTDNAGGKYSYWSGEDGRVVGNYAKLLFPVNASTHLISDWKTYREVLEMSRECIVVNTHGEILPIPSGYVAETWVDKIAEAMLQRSLTWVHVAGYPFYYYKHEFSDIKEWGILGFQQFMEHIGRYNITCSSPDENDRDWVSFRAHDPLFRGVWSSGQYSSVTRNYPLKESDFGGILALNIWGDVDYFPGAVIAFKISENQSAFGFYVHIGTLQTYAEGGVLYDRDFWRDYVSAAAVLWGVLGRSVAEYKLAEAGNAIQQARSEGRTEGLDEASYLLNDAYMLFERFFYNEGTIVNTYRVIVKASEAKTPSTQPIINPLIAIPLIISVGLGLSFIRWKRKSSINDIR